MPQSRLRAVFMRGGTSKAVMFRRADLPDDQASWPSIFTRIMGSPDPNMRQLDGMGGGISSLSKICIIGPSSRADADVDYTFAQVSVDSDLVDFASNCGNMSSAIGPFAVEEGFVARPNGVDAVVRIHNTNTQKIIVSRFQMDGDYAAVEGGLILDGVGGSGAPIKLDFLSPAGARTGKLLPAGPATKMLDVPELGPIAASMIDAAAPCVFVRAGDLDCTGTERPDAMERDTLLMEKLENIRRAASVAMGIAADPGAAANIRSAPKVAMVTLPVEQRTLSGRVMAPGESDILVRMISVGQPHRAVPLTGALCLAVACRVPGSIPHDIAAGTGDVRIGHPSGMVLVTADVRVGPAGIEAPSATVYRTARRLFQGDVLFRTPQ
ncbi:MAG: PrpF family protein [Acetobacteraceae bacterium]|nr:PrpF family protein [Acetobacteraceae bacterium]